MKNNPKSLYPKKNESFEDKLLKFVDNHASFAILFCFIMLSLLFAILINIVYGMCVYEHVCNAPLI